MSFQFERGEILLVDKPYRWTSFDVIGKLRTVVRKRTGIRKIKMGHAGTLDPLATGLLIICTGTFTKRIEEFQGLEKEYTGTMHLGVTTPSFDLETEPDHVAGTGHITEELIHEAVRHFTGTFEQISPRFSAKKIAGKRAYDYARKDEEVDIKPHLVTVSMFEITRIEMPCIDFRVSCSKGTYIRSLARDVGAYLGCGAHLSALCRTRIGPYHLRDAWDLESLEKAIPERIPGQELDHNSALNGGGASEPGLKPNTKSGQTRAGGFMSDQEHDHNSALNGGGATEPGHKPETKSGSAGPGDAEPGSRSHRSQE